MNKILVTGADGFIGSHLVEYLVQQGHKIKALCFYNSFGHSGWLSNSTLFNNDNVEIVYGDIRDASVVEDAVKGCDTIFHLAALIAIPYSYKAPSSYVETNIIGTLNVLMAAKKNNIRVIHTSTSEVYGTAQYIPIDEKHPLNAQSPYAATKIGADQLVMSFFASYNLPVSIVRPFNTFGPKQSGRAIIPTIISQLLGKKILSIGAIETSRDFTYIEDTIMGIAAFLHSSGSIGKIINLGVGFEITVNDLIKEIAYILKVDIDLQTDIERLRPKNSEVMRLCSDNSLAKSILQWSPKYSGLDGLRVGLKKTIEWFSTYEGLKINHVYENFTY